MEEFGQLLLDVARGLPSRADQRGGSAQRPRALPPLAGRSGPGAALGTVAAGGRYGRGRRMSARGRLRRNITAISPPPNSSSCSPGAAVARSVASMPPSGGPCRPERFPKV